MLADIAITLGKELILPEILKVLRRDDIPVSNRNAPEVAEAIAERLAPTVVNKANAEPWYQSNVTWGALVSIGTGLLALAGYTLAPQDIDQIVVVGTAVGTAVGGLWTLYGRWKAKKPLGQ